MYKAINSTGNNKSKWIKCLSPRSAPRLRLICFPYAGGGINVYKRWPPFFSKDIEVHAVHLPGRESRYKEGFAKTMNEVAKSVASELAQYRKQPLAFFGHSMGAIVAYEVARTLKKKYDWELEALIVSGRRPPHIYTGGDLHKQPDQVFISEICRYNGTPPEVFADTELRQLFLPILRSDYTILENYEYMPSDVLSCPIAACAGEKDAKFAPAEELEAWKDLSSGPFTFHVFEGDHFYLNESVEQLTDFVKKCLSNRVSEMVVQ